MTQSSQRRLDELAYTRAFIEDMVQRYPQRRATSQQETQAQKRMMDEFKSVELDVSEETFRFHDHLYANLALHFGIVIAGTAAYPSWPWLALFLHTLVFISYALDTTHKMYLLRRIFPWGESRNILGRAVASQPVRLRFVFISHIDAAFTGKMFEPQAVRRSAHLPTALAFLKKQMRLVMLSVFCLILLDLVFLMTHSAYSTLAWLCTVPSIIAVVLNLDVVIKNETVPGAADNLSGCSALPLLASRLSDWKPNDIELIFVSTGAEEASLGGSDTLARRYTSEWSTSNTIVFALDGLSGGELQFLEEGELFPIPFSSRLRKEIEETAQSEKRFEEIKCFSIPVGGTDALPFLMRGYEAVGFSCINLDLGAPDHYHLPSDTPEHIDPEKIVYCIDFIEQLVHTVAEKRKGSDPS